MAGFESVASEMAKTGEEVKMPGSTTLNHAVEIPDDAMPVMAPLFTNGTIANMPVWEDQNFTQTELLVLPTPALQTLSPSFELFTTSNQMVSLDNAMIEIRAQITTQAGYASGSQPFAFNGTDGDAYIFDEGGLMSLLSNMTVQMNGVPLPNYQNGNLVQQMYVHTVTVPMTYSGDVCYAYNTQLMTAQGDLGTTQSFNRKKQGAIKPFSDFSGWSNIPATSAVGQTVYFRVPLKQLWTFYQQPGRMFTNDASMRFNFVLNSLTLRGTQIKTAPQASSGHFDGPVVAAVAAIYMPTTQSISQPVYITITDMIMAFPLFNTKQQVQDMVTATVAETPLSMLMNNVEVYQDPTLSQIDMSVVANWGKGPIRTMVKGSGYLPHHVVMVPTCNVTWSPTGVAPNQQNPFNVAGLSWTRSIILPGMAYYRRIYLGGQPYYDDPVVAQWGPSSVLSQIGGWTTYVGKAMRKFQQQGNYLDAPDQMVLNAYTNAGQLAPCAATNIDLAATYLGLSPADLNAAQKLLLWVMGMGANGISISQTTSFDELADSRTQSLEVETYTMPYWGTIAAATQWPLAFFAGVDNVWQQQAGGDNVPEIMLPTATIMNIQHCLPYTMVVDYGRGRTTQYYYAQPTQNPLSNVPM